MQEIADWLDKLGMSQYAQRPKTILTFVPFGI
jgi:hypothetical protein